MNNNNMNNNNINNNNINNNNIINNNINSNNSNNNYYIINNETPEERFDYAVKVLDMIKRIKEGFYTKKDDNFIRGKFSWENQSHATEIIQNPQNDPFGYLRELERGAYKLLADSILEILSNYSIPQYSNANSNSNNHGSGNASSQAEGGDSNGSNLNSMISNWETNVENAPDITDNYLPFILPENNQTLAFLPEGFSAVCAIVISAFHISNAIIIYCIAFFSFSFSFFFFFFFFFFLFLFLFL